MKPFLVTHLVAFICSIQTVASIQFAKKGCKDTCGNVTIPYPFGIGADCAVNKWYVVDCNSSSTPYLLKHYQVLRVDLKSQRVIVYAPGISGSGNSLRNTNYVVTVDLGMAPFIVSRNNHLTFKGCGNAIIRSRGRMVGGCSTTCVNDSTIDEIDPDQCFGISCCTAPISVYENDSYTINLTQPRMPGGDEVCGSAFVKVEDASSYIEGSVSGRSVDGYAPMELDWFLSSSDMTQIECCGCDADAVEKYGPLNGTWWECRLFSTLEGNPYLSRGCGESEECRHCKERGRYCEYWKNVYSGSLYTSNFTCSESISIVVTHESKWSLGVILGVSISMGLVFLVATSYSLYRVIKKMKAKRRRMKYFKRNGGLLLKQQKEADSSLVDKTITFTSRELEKATDCFNENRILGRGGQGTVYKGMLMDGRIVAVKKSKLVDESQLEQFINEVVILSQVNHRNVVKLLGCCLETEVPLLVSEFIPNGTLHDYIHNGVDDLPISFSMRLQIATEVSGALSYLHSSTSIPIYHRDIKSSNILLDDKYRAKVSDFGTSRFVSTDQTHLTTLVKGTLGYLDPEYFLSSQFTDKSDVYSFGVVLVELLTGERPISHTRFGEHRNLSTHFMLAMEGGRVMSIFDATVIKEGSRDDLLMVSNLAMRCLNLNGKNRPTMKEVFMELEAIRKSQIPSTVQINTGQVIYGEKMEMMTYGASTSTTFLSFEDNISHLI